MPLSPSGVVMEDLHRVTGPLMAGVPGAPALGWVWVEFDNRPDPGVPVTPPSYGPTPDQGAPYYLGLSGHPTRDVLRVPVLSAGSRAVGSDTLVEAWASAAGSAGIHGKPFAAASNSTVVGFGLAAAPDPADPSRDLVVYRTYLPGAEQSVVPAAGGEEVLLQVVLTR